MTLLYDLKMPFGVSQNVWQFPIAIFKMNPISWLHITLMKPFKKNVKMFYALNLRKSCWAESGAVRHSSSGPQTVINRALSVWSHDTSWGTEVTKVCSSCMKSLSHWGTSCHASASGKKGGSWSQTHRGPFTPIRTQRIRAHMDLHAITQLI